VGEGGGEFREEGQMSLLAGGKRSTRFGYGSDEGFVIGEKDNVTTFLGESEMADCKVSCKEFSVKSGVPGFCGESLWEKKLGASRNHENIVA
jgi:hypothetical protein